MAEITIVRLSELEGLKRMDAEYYRSEYFTLLAKLQQAGCLPLKKIATSVKRRFKPIKGKLFNYIEIAQVNLSTGEFSTSKIIGEEAPDRAQWEVKKGDILISTVRPIRNAVVLIRDEIENLVCSSGFAVIRPKAPVSSEYLFLYLKIKFIARLLNRYTTATEYPAVTWNDVLDIPIFLADEEFRNEISKNVDKAFDLLKQSKNFYHQAENLLLEKLGLKNFIQNIDSIIQQLAKNDDAFNFWRS